MNIVDLFQSSKKLNCIYIGFNSFGKTVAVILFPEEAMFALYKNRICLAVKKAVGHYLNFWQLQFRTETL